jgi:hypothetical protein
MKIVSPTSCALFRDRSYTREPAHLSGAAGSLMGAAMTMFLECRGLSDTGYIDQSESRFKGFLPLFAAFSKADPGMIRLMRKSPWKEQKAPISAQISPLS